LLNKMYFYWEQIATKNYYATKYSLYVTQMLLLETLLIVSEMLGVLKQLQPTLTSKRNYLT